MQFLNVDVVQLKNIYKLAELMRKPPYIIDNPFCSVLVQWATQWLALSIRTGFHTQHCDNKFSISRSPRSLNIMGIFLCLNSKEKRLGHFK